MHLSWSESLLGTDLHGILKNWWFFIALPPAVLYLVSLGCGQWQKRIFRGHRAELMELIADAKLDRDTVLVMLRDVGDLDAVVQELKLDHA